MQITAARLQLVQPTSKPMPDPDPPTHPQQPRELLGSTLAAARDAAVQALVATTATDRVDPTTARSTQFAQAALGRAVGLIDAATGIALLAPDVLYNELVLRNPLAAASDIIARAVAASPGAADRAAIAQARWQVQQSLRQFDYVLTKFWPTAARA